MQASPGEAARVSWTFLESEQGRGMGCAHCHLPQGENKLSPYPTLGVTWLGVRKGQFEVGEVSILLVLLLF